MNTSISEYPSDRPNDQVVMAPCNARTVPAPRGRNCERERTYALETRAITILAGTSWNRGDTFVTYGAPEGGHHDRRRTSQQSEIPVHQRLPDQRGHERRDGEE